MLVMVAEAVPAVPVSAVPVSAVPVTAVPVFGVTSARSEERSAVLWAAEQARVAVADLARSVREVGRESDPGELKEALAVLDGVTTVLGVARLGVLRLVREAGRWNPSGRPRTFAEQRGIESGQGLAAARGEERVADTLAQLSTVRTAAEQGGVPLGHVEVVAQVLAGASENTLARMVAQEEEILRTAQSVSAPELRRNLTALRAAMEADSADHGFENVRAQRFLKLSRRDGGVRVDGLLDVVAGETLRTALEALTPDPAVGDHRTPDQRRADALVLLANRTLGLGDAKAGAQVRPHLSLLVREDTWLLLKRRRRELCGSAGSGVTGAGGAGSGVTGAGGGAEAGAGSGVGAPLRAGYPIAGLSGSAFRHSGLPTEPPLAQLLDGTLIPFAALDVLACDALIQRVVLDAQGSPLDIGRTERTFTKDLRRAALARDRHCQWPGCQMRATWCEVHHIQYWENDGVTSLENAVTLCSRHHHDVHKGAVRIQKSPGCFVFTEYTGVRIGHTTRLHDDLLVPRARPGPDRGRTGDVSGEGGSRRGSPGLSDVSGSPPSRHAPPGGEPPGGSDVSGPPPSLQAAPGDEQVIPPCDSDALW